MTKVKGVPYKSGQHKGEDRPDVYTDHYTLGTVDGLYPVVWAFWRKPGEMYLAKIGWTFEDRHEVRLVTELKELIEEHYAPSTLDSPEPE